MKFILLPMLAICLAALASGQSTAPERPPSPEAELRLDAEIEKGSVRVGEGTSLKVRIKNVSRNPVAIYKNPGWVDPFTFVVTDSKDERLLPKRLLENFDAAHRKRDDYVVLQPGEEYREERSLNLRDEYHDGALPGEYQVLVLFRGTKGREEAPAGVRLWTADDPELKAGPFTIKVVE